jgi:hypothetical protein
MVCCWYSNCITELVTEMPRCFSTSIQSEVAWRALLRPLTVPASWIAPPKSSSFLGQRRLAGVGVGNDREGAPFGDVAQDFGGKAAVVPGVAQGWYSSGSFRRQQTKAAGRDAES